MSATETQPKSDFLSRLIAHIEEHFPPFLKGRDLVQLGLFTNTQNLKNLRESGGGPEFVRTGKNQYAYPSSSVVAWLRAGGYGHAIKANETSLAQGE